VYQRGSLLDGLAMYLSCDTKKFHDNESTHIFHIFGRPPIGGKLTSLLTPGGATGSGGVILVKVSLYGRYQMFLQLKLDVLTGRLPCADDDAAQLAALALQCQ